MFAAAGVPPRARQRPPVPARRIRGSSRRSAQLSEDHGRLPALAACGRRISARPTRTGATTRTSRTTISAAPISAISPRWSTNPADLVQPRAGNAGLHHAGATRRFDKYRKGAPTDDDLSRCREGQTERRWQMISYARQNQDGSSRSATPSVDEHIAPAPRVSVQAFCETVETAAAVQAAGEDRRLGKAHLKIQMGGMAAAIEAYRTAPTPNVIILETEGRNNILAGLDQLAAVCDAGTRVIVIGRINDVSLYRELVRRGVSDYVIAPVTTIDVVRSICNLFSSPEAKAGRPHHRRRRRQGRRRRLDHRPQHRLGDRPRPGARFGGRRPRPRLRHRRPRLQPGSAAGHCGRGVLARPRRHRLHRPPAVEMHRSSEPAGGAGDARPGLRFRRRRVRLDLRHAALLDAMHRARRAASVVGLDQARADRRRRHPDRRGARPRQPAQHQEHLRPAEGVAAERPRAALLPQPGRRAEAPRDRGERVRQGDREPADRDHPVRSADVRRCRQQRPDDRGDLRQSQDHRDVPADGAAPDRPRRNQEVEAIRCSRP